jgi:hypothetical protein
MQPLSTLLVAGTLFILSPISAAQDHSQAGIRELRLGESTFRHVLNKTSRDTIAQDYAMERENRPTPKIGLALSGGGTRAALFSHGVLNGLHDSGVLERVDVISSVSGGSYAAYWYFSKLLEKATPKQIFADCLPTWWVSGTSSGSDANAETLKALMERARERRRMPDCSNTLHWEEGDPYRWQAHLARWPDMFRTAPGYIDGDSQGAPILLALAHVPGLILEFPLGPFIEDSILPMEYHHGIERVWGLSPLPRIVPRNPTVKDDENTKWTYSNDTGNPGTTDMHVNPAHAGWTGLADRYRSDPKLPLWIANATQGTKGDAPEPKNIYELTPLSHGSSKRGYRNESPLAAGVSDLGRGTLASAAFADRQGVSNPLYRIPMHLHKAATWGIDIDNRFGGIPKTLHLSDGGGAENLGLYSLIRRGVPDIIIVDTAQDLTGKMDDLCWVKAALAIDDLKMKFGALDQLDQLCASWVQEPDPKKWPHKKKRTEKLAYNTSAWLNPVVTGIVKWPEKSGMPDTRLWLVKLGWNQQAFRRAYNARDCDSDANPVNCLLTVYYGHNTATINKRDQYMVFPHLSTVGAQYNSSSYLFWAYRELGRMLSSNLVWTDAEGGRLELKRKTPQCSQKAMTYIAKQRPKTRPETPDEDPTYCE